MDNYGMFADTHDTARVNSLVLAEMFGKKHKNVLQAIENLDCSEEFNRLNFQPVKYKDSKGELRPCYAMTRDGFTFVAMGFTGKKAAQFKEAYIKRFNEMEKFIGTLVETRQEFPLLAANIKLIHENPRPYHFSNEADMLNKLVIGQTAKQFRQAHGLDKHESIRPHLTDNQIKMLDTLQKVDIGLLLAMPDFEQRKRQLQWYISQTFGKMIGA